MGLSVYAYKQPNKGIIANVVQINKNNAISGIKYLIPHVEAPIELGAQGIEEINTIEPNE
jgi:hypothetical protein